jgi:hypothetical protein
VKPFGPVHEYDASVTVGVESWIVPPTQYGPPFDAVGTVADGALTTTSVEAVAEVQPLKTVTVYVPASASVAFGIVGNSCEEVKPFGPVHEYVERVTKGVVNKIVLPTQ